MIRLIIVVLFVVLFLILSIPIMFVEWIIGKFNPGVKDRSSLAIVNCLSLFAFTDRDHLLFTRKSHVYSPGPTVHSPV